MNKKILPPTWLLVAILLMIGLHFVIPVTAIVPPLWNLLGLIPLILGIAIDFQADRAFHQAHTTVQPFGMPSTLVTWGAFRFSRNPMYLGFVLILAGVAVLLGSLNPFLVIPVFYVWIERGYIAFEEQALADRFGPAWSKYKGNTRRWL
jgi:protein-S-isoprenylcysteine O-methyltransferase Ste14